MVNASTSATYRLHDRVGSEKLPLLFGGGVCPREAFRRQSAHLLLDVVRLE
jgi:hypothetical protein